jgi:hypothetical protein
MTRISSYPRPLSPARVSKGLTLMALMLASWVPVLVLLRLAGLV